MANNKSEKSLLRNVAALSVPNLGGSLTPEGNFLQV